jgi:hypothetical protein
MSPESGDEWHEFQIVAGIVGSNAEVEVPPVMAAWSISDFDELTHER